MEVSLTNETGIILRILEYNVLEQTVLLYGLKKRFNISLCET